MALNDGQRCSSLWVSGMEVVARSNKYVKKAAEVFAAQAAISAHEHVMAQVEPLLWAAVQKSANLFIGHWLTDNLFLIFACHGIASLSKRASVDRKSTRLNSSHVRISYAVFCL